MKVSVTAFLLFLLLSGCDPAVQKEERNRPPVREPIHDVVITEDDYLDEWKSLSLREKREYKEKDSFLRKRNDDAILSRLGLEKGYGTDIHIARKVALYKRGLVRNQFIQKDIRDKITEKDMENYYNKNKHLFVEPARIRVRHILLDSQQEAETIQEELLRDKKKFQEFAQLYSIDSTASNGGDLGFFSRGRMLPDFEKEAFLLRNPGDISKVVKTRFGYHLIQLVSKKEKRQLRMLEVEDRIYDIVTEQEKRIILNGQKTLKGGAGQI